MYDDDTPSALEQLLASTGLKPSECSCRVCRQKCTEMVCLGTPDDIVRLINAGYTLLLRRVMMKVVMVHQRRVMDVGMIQLMSDDNGCALFKDGHCIVHHLGLKPTEGRYYLHPRNHKEETLMGVLTLAVAMEWLNDNNRRKVEYCFSKLSSV